MVADWRSKLNLENLNFAYVELAALQNNTCATYYPWQHAAQAAALWLPHVRVATDLDHADPASPAGAIHLQCKQEVGRHLALVMQAIHYNGTKAQQVYTGPIMAEVGLQIDPAHLTA